MVLECSRSLDDLPSCRSLHHTNFRSQLIVAELVDARRPSRRVSLVILIAIISSFVNISCSAPNSKFLPPDTRPQAIRLWTVGSDHRVGKPIEIRGEVVANRRGERLQLLTVSILRGGVTYAQDSVVEEPSKDQIHYPFRVALDPDFRPGVYSAKAQGFYFLRTPGVAEQEDPGRTVLVESIPIRLDVKGARK